MDNAANTSRVQVVKVIQENKPLPSISSPPRCCRLSLSGSLMAKRTSFDGYISSDASSSPTIPPSVMDSSPNSPLSIELDEEEDLDIIDLDDGKLEAPINFAPVIPGVYRSSFPQRRNLSFLKTLHLKTILTLVPKQFSPAIKEYISEGGIQHIEIPIEANKDPSKVVSPANMVAALGVVLDRAHHPLLIHCNKGKHRTGCVIGCFRKVLGVAPKAVSEEYVRFAGLKARYLDEKFIESFDERVMLWLALDNDFATLAEPMYESPASALATRPRLKS